MNINITLFGQMITFAIFVFVTMKFIWPNLNKALEDREHKIMQGLQAAEKGQQKLKMANGSSTEQAASLSMKMPSNTGGHLHSGFPMRL